MSLVIQCWCICCFVLRGNPHPFFCFANESNVCLFSSFHIYRSFRSTVISAVMATTRRSLQLGGVSAEDIQHKYNL